MKYLSTFSGIGGFELGIQQAYESNQKKTERIGQENPQGIRSGEDKGDHERNQELGTSGTESRERFDGSGDRQPVCIGYSEIDKYAIQVYGKHFDHPNFGSIRDIVAEELPDFGLLCGGFPCQSFSIAGKRGGFEDTRGTLFFDIARIAKVKRPRLLWLENVKGLLSHDDGRTFNTIINTLDELGYDVQWQVLNSKNFGVPQNRERIFIIGHLRGTPRPQVFPFREDSEADIVLPTLTTRYYGGQANGGYIGNISQLNDPTHSNDRVYGESGISPALNTMQEGNRQPKIAIPVLTPDRPVKRQNGRRFKEDGEPSFTLTAHDKHGVMVPANTKQGYEVAEEGDSINLAIPSSTTRRGRVGKGVAQTLDTGMQQHTIQDMKIRRLTPVECERLQGFPDGWTEGISDSQRYKCLGNAVTVNVIQKIAERLL